MSAEETCRYKTSQLFFSLILWFISFLEFDFSNIFCLIESFSAVSDTLTLFSSV